MSRVKFIESTHTYLLNDETENQLISVSAFMDSFKQKTDWEAIAKRSAAKATKLTGKKVTQQDILAKWANKRDMASSIGTLLHSIKEQETINDSSQTFYGLQCEKECGIFEDSLKFSIPINTLTNNTVYPEMMIYDEEHMLCGQSDKVIVINNKINIWDYKTDEEIKMKGYSNQWQPAKRLLGCLSHLEECSGVIYSLKMSLYMYMLWKANKGRFLPGDIIIEHVHLKRDPNNDNIPVLENGHPVVLKIEQIKLPYRKKEVEAMLKTLKKK